MVMFAPATKRQAKLRLALAGPAGSGKTFTALVLASSLAEGGRVAVVDTEHGSASKYADRWSFDVLELDDFSPDHYIEAIRAAEASGYAVLVIDSLSHEWEGRSGILQMVDAAAARDRSGGSFNAWRTVTPKHDALIQAIVSSRIHVIATLRAKMEYVQERNERTGRMEPRAVGMKPIQRDNVEYEFDVYGMLDQDNRLVIRKSRCPDLSGQLIDKPGADVGGILLGWLAGAPDDAPDNVRPFAAPTRPDTVTLAGDVGAATSSDPATSDIPAEPDGDIDERLEAATQKNGGHRRAAPEPTAQEQARADAVVGDDLRTRSIRRYKQLAKIATNRKHEAADRINAVDPETLNPRSLAASVKRLEEFFPDIPELSAKQARDLGL